MGLQGALADDGALSLVLGDPVDLAESTNRRSAGTFACFIESTTSLSSAWL